MSALSHKRNFGCVRILLLDADYASRINTSIIITRAASIYQPSSRVSCRAAIADSVDARLSPLFWTERPCTAHQDRVHDTLFQTSKHEACDLHDDPGGNDVYAGRSKDLSTPEFPEESLKPRHRHSLTLGDTVIALRNEQHSSCRSILIVS